MSSFITLGHVEVQDANCIAGITYGFPAVTQFLGFVHALSRKFKNSQKYASVSLDGCMIVCHDYQLHVFKPDKYSDYYFSQTKNPSAGRYQANSKGNPPPVIEEGKMNMTVSLIIECVGFSGDDEDVKTFQHYVKNLALRHRLAAGRIMSIKDVNFETIIDDIGFKRLRRRLFPGFVLKNRNEYLAEHLKNIQKQNVEADTLEAWLDFSAIKYKAEPILKEGEELSEKTNAKWNYIPKPFGGYLVPLAVGYQPISKLYNPGEVANTRDPTTHFCFVESVYGIGEWLSPHRINNLDEVIWRYHKDKYLCIQNSEDNSKNQSDDIDEDILSEFF